MGGLFVSLNARSSYSEGSKMMKSLFHNISRVSFLKNLSGSTAIEYALVAAGIALAIVVVVFTVGDEVLVMFQNVLTALTTAGTA